VGVEVARVELVVVADWRLVVKPAV